MSFRQRTLKYGVVAAAVALAIIVGATLSIPSLTSLQTSSGTGALNIYLTDAPPQTQALNRLIINVSSITFRYEGSIETTSTTSSTSSGASISTTTSASSSTPDETENNFVYQVPSSIGTNVDLLKLKGQSLLLGATHEPAGTITSIVIGITGAKAFYADGTSEQLMLAADGKLMVPIEFNVLKDGSTNLTIDIQPNLVHISQGDVLTPVIHVTSVEQGEGGTSTHTGGVDESQTSDSTLTTTSTTTSHGP